MASSNNLEKICIFYILSASFCFFGQSQILDFHEIGNLNDSSEKLLQYISISKIPKHDSNVLLPTASKSSELNTRNIPRVSVLKRKRKTGKCIADLIYILNNLERPWAVQMLDSVGKVSSGLLRGAIHWPGHYRECLDVYAPLDEKGNGDFHGKYCTSGWTLNASSITVNIGLCVPDSCTGNDVKIAFKTTLRTKGYIPYFNRLKSQLILKNVDCKTGDRPLDTPSIIYLYVISVFIILTVMGSVLDLFHSRKLENVTRSIQSSTMQAESCDTLNVEKDVVVNNQLSATFEKDPSFEETGFTSSQIDIFIIEKTVSAVESFLLCFSVFSNGPKILNMRYSENHLLSIHGIRALNVIWIIYGHVYTVGIEFFANYVDVVTSLDTLVSQVTFQTTLAVDSFLVLSGFFLTYLFLKEAIKKQRKINWIHFYLHRIWRLTPPYLAVTFFYMLIFKYIGSGPLWDDNFCDSVRSTWWKYVLYIHNFIPFKDMCPNWMWYLGLDMQFYVISPLFLYALWKWPKFGFSILGSLCFATWTITAVISYSYDVIPFFAGNIKDTDVQIFRKRSEDFLNTIYFKPYCRIAPYVIGVVLGYIFHKTDGRRNFLTWWQQLLGWIIGLFCIMSSVFGLYHAELTRISAMFHNALFRSSFAVGLAWLIYACETGHGGYIKKFLSWKFFIPVSRLSYSMYLVHQVIIDFYYRSEETRPNATTFMVIVNFTGFFILSYGAAVIFSLIFELPFMNLEKLILRRKKN